MYSWPARTPKSGSDAQRECASSDRSPRRAGGIGSASSRRRTVGGDSRRGLRVASYVTGGTVAQPPLRRADRTSGDGEAGSPPLLIELGLDRADVSAGALAAHPSGLVAVPCLDDVNAPRQRGIAVFHGIGHPVTDRARFLHTPFLRGRGLGLTRHPARGRLSTDEREQGSRGARTLARRYELTYRSPIVAPWHASWLVDLSRKLILAPPKSAD